MKAKKYVIAIRQPMGPQFLNQTRFLDKRDAVDWVERARKSDYYKGADFEILREC